MQKHKKSPSASGPLASLSWLRSLFSSSFSPFSSISAAQNFAVPADIEYQQ
jgi:hypothetical protein